MLIQRQCFKLNLNQTLSHFYDWFEEEEHKIIDLCPPVLSQFEFFEFLRVRQEVEDG